MIKLFITFFVVLSLLSPQAAFAGGGPVSLSAFPLRPFDQTKIFILQADVYTNQSCNQIQPTFSFAENIDGDSITPFTSRNDPTYITRHYNTGYPDFVWKEICTTYAQTKSGQPIQRVLKVSVVVNGKTEERTTPVAFGDDYLSKQLQNFGRVNDYDNTPQPDVISERYLGGPKREVKLQWQKISWAAKYAVFAKQVLSDGTIDQTPLAPLAVTENTQAIINLAAFSEFYVNAIACKAEDPCTANKQDGYSFLLPKMYITNQQPQTTPTPLVQKAITLAPTNIEEARPVVIPTAIEDKKIEELNQKVAELEGQLQKSQKKQNVLEQRINDLVTFIKRLFPFFK